MKSKKRRLKRFLILFVLALLLLPAGLYFLVSTEYFLRSVVLPRVEKASGYRLEAETIRFSPFSSLELHKGDLRNSDGSLAATFEDLVVAYDLFDLMKERVTVRELTLRNPDITLTLPLPADEEDGEEKPESDSTKQPPELDLANLKVENGTLTVNTADATTVIRNLNFQLPALRSGEPVEPELAFAFELTPTNGEKLSGSLDANARFILDRKFNLSDLSATLAGRLRPPGPGPDELRLHFDTALQPRLDAKRLDIQTLSARAGFEGRDLLTLSLSNPATVDWSGDQPSFTDTTLKLAVNDLRLSELNLEGLLPVKTARIRLDAAVEIADSGRQLSAKGDFNLADVSGVVAGVVLDGWSAAGTLDASGNPEGIRISESTVRLSRAGTDALHVSATGEADWDAADARANLVLHRVHLDTLRSLYPEAPAATGTLNGSASLTRTSGGGHSWDLTLNGDGISLPDLLSGVGGSVASSGSLTAAPDWSRMEGEGTLDLQDLRGEVSGVSLNDWSALASVDGGVEPDTLKLGATSLKLTRSGQTALDLRAEGGAARDLGTGNVSLDLETADLALMRTLAPQAPELAGILSGSAKAAREADRLDWVGQFTAQGLKVPGNQPIPSPVQLSTSGQREGARLTLKPSTLSWPKTEQFDNLINLEGSLDATRPGAMVASFNLNGGAVDLTPWIPPAAAKAPPPATEPADGGLPATEPELPDLPFTGSRLEAAFAHLRIDDIHIREFTLRTGLETRSVVLDTLALSLNGAPVEASGRFDWTAGPPDYALALKLDPVEVQPIVNRLMPDKRDAVRGVLTANADLKGRGLTGPRLRENLDGSFSMNFRDGQVRILDQKPERNAGLVHTRELLIDVVTVLARALRLPPEDLLAPPVTDIRVDSRVADGRLNLADFTLVNPEIHLSSKGTVDLAEALPESQFQRMPVVVGVNTNLAKRLKIYRVDRVREDRVFLPSFLAVTGTLGEPEIDVDKSVVTGLILSGVTERNDLGSDKANEILRTVGGLLSGEGPPPTPTPKPSAPPPPGATPTPTPKPSDAERVLRGIQILRDIRATPTPAK